MRRVSEKEWRELAEETKRLYVEENVWGDNIKSLLAG